MVKMSFRWEHQMRRWVPMGVWNKIGERVTLSPCSEALEKRRVLVCCVWVVHLAVQVVDGRSVPLACPACLCWWFLPVELGLRTLEVEILLFPLWHWPQHCGRMDDRGRARRARRADWGGGQARCHCLALLGLAPLQPPLPPPTSS